jgi:DNA-binding transcriptional LysR family regulator
METKWLEDFLSVAETLNFSRSARLRNVTQPAFCRRIQALEKWLGAELFDRTGYPTRLSPAGQVFLTHAREMLEYTIHSRSVLRGKSVDSQSLVTFSMPHTLSMTYFPRWLSDVEQFVGKMAVKVEVGNTHDAVMQLVEGSCDLLMCYHRPYQSIELDSDRYEILVIGDEPLRPYSKVGPDGAPMYVLPGTADKPLPFLCYSPSTVLGRIVERVLSDDPQPVHLFRKYEGDLALALKMMALQGQGIAWLPYSAAVDDVEAGNLAYAIDPQLLALAGEGSYGWSGAMQIRLYRDREARRPLVDRIWNYLVGKYSSEEQ